MFSLTDKHDFFGTTVKDHDIFGCTDDINGIVSKVSIKDLNIRKGAGTNFDRVQFCPVGVYTIVEVKSGAGSKSGWGRLKSGIGWLSLDFVKRV